MNHLKYILTFAFLVVGLNLFAQTDTVQYGKLEVKVIDAMNKKPLEFARVSVSINGKKAFKYTDIDGECTFGKIQYGKHLISISLSGYKKLDDYEIDIQKNITGFSKTLQSLNETYVYIAHNKIINCFKPEKEIENFSPLKLLIIDSFTKKPIEYARVKITAKDFIKIAFSDSVGEIVFDSLQFKPYQLDISYYGYYKRNINCFPINSIIPDTLVIKLIVNPDIKIIESRCPPPLIKPDEPTQQNLNNKQIMRIPF